MRTGCGTQSARESERITAKELNEKESVSVWEQGRTRRLVRSGKSLAPSGQRDRKTEENGAAQRRTQKSEKVNSPFETVET